uniref:DUF538 domain-containing protein n=1 Tax=Ananas comosus var. bracteatus TaxID=296719 RepID=A0A6V7QT49_ANACO
MKFILLFVFFLLSLSLKPSMSSSAAAAAAAAESAYEVLQSHGLPKGLLPKGITEFRFDDDGGGGGGKFEAVLEAPCTAKFESGVHYNATVSGALSYGEIAPLSGVSAQELFLWFPVLGIRVDVPSSGLIHFDVGGVVHKQFPLSLFDSPPDCTPDDDDDQSTSRIGKLRYELDRAEARRAVV